MQAEDLAVNLRAALATLTDDSVHFDRGPADLRSNAGLTKVYSLVLDDFIIYDSRVAAALAWLVMIWGREVGGVPDREVCLHAGKKKQFKGKTSKPMKLRSPGTEDFPYFRHPSSSVATGGTPYGTCAPIMCWQRHSRRLADVGPIWRQLVFRP